MEQNKNLNKQAIHSFNLRTAARQFKEHSDIYCAFRGDFRTAEGRRISNNVYDSRKVLFQVIDDLPKNLQG